MHTPNSLLKKIAGLQSVGDQYFQAGLFPSYRYHHHLPYKRPDNNIFFTASITFILQSLQDKLSSEDQTIASNIAKKAVACYPAYQNKNGLKTYGFWQNHPPHHFPHGRIMSRLDHFLVPDDIDDTAMVYLTTNPTADELHWLKAKLDQHANLSNRMNLTTPRKYRRLSVYSTFFGKNMAIQFDFCALCNLMYLIFKHKMPFERRDEDTLLFLSEVIASNDHLNQPYYVAPNYGKATLILYHAARLCQSFNHPALNQIRGKMTTDLRHLAGLVTDPGDQLLVAIAQLKLGQKPLPISKPERLEGAISFFLAPMLSAYEGLIARKLAPNSWFHLHYWCKAYYWCLVLEYEVLQLGSIES
ncbi:MAG: hypothetical protein ACR2MX_09725 [Cyclobacteriaceae bacterium]